MAMHIPRPQMFKEGTQNFLGIEEAVLRSIDVCTELSRSLKTCLGPMGLNKMVINHLEKLFVTNDAATILSQLDIQHPSAKILVMASQTVEKEVGDGTNFVITFAGALLEKAEELIRMGLKPIEIIEGYEVARDKVLDELLVELVVDEVKDFHNITEVTKGIKTSIASKQFGNEDFLSKIIGEACIAIMPKSSAFNVDNVRVAKILGSGLSSSQVVAGMVFKKNVEGTVTKASNAKIAIYACPVDVATTETKGTVLIKNAGELVSFSRGEEEIFEGQISSIAKTGTKIIASGGKFSDLALHFCNKYGLMAVRINSKFDLRRLAKTVGATVLPNLQTPKIEELGHCDEVYIDEIGGTSVVIFKQLSASSKISTLVLRGSSDNVLDDIERAVDDGVNTFKALTKDGRLLPGAGSVEIELSRRVSSFAETLPGMEQYAVEKFAEALIALPAAIAENAGIKHDIVRKLLAEHESGGTNMGLDISSDDGGVLNAVQNGIFDLYSAKYWGIKYAVSAACTVLQVDQIICAKPAGGPKAKGPQPVDPE